MKSTIGWSSPNAGATNSSGFAGLPGGYRNSDGAFNSIGLSGNWWSSTEYDTAGGLDRPLKYQPSGVGRANDDKRLGFAVRCVRD